jgi:hypothetical protein
MRTFVVLLVAVLPVLAADEDPTEVLIRLRAQVLAHADRIPNYTCVETVHRDRFESITAAPKTCDDTMARRKQANFSKMLRPTTSDRLRLDVAVSDSGGEIFSWAGAPKFAEGDIDELIPDGAMGTGMFAAMLLGVFKGRPPRFTFDGDTMLDHRLVYQYSYKVLREDSHYRVKARGEWIITGYDASLGVDPATAELVRLTVRTDELPPATGLCQTDTTLDYGMVQLGNGDYMLPKNTIERFIEREGSESENQVTFAACREFRGESTLSFGERPRRGEEEAAPPTQPLPPGLPVAIDLVTDIHDDAAAGDRIAGKLAKPIRDPKGAVLVPEGALAVGRLMRVEVRHGRTPETVLTLRWETLDQRGAAAAVALLPARTMIEKLRGSGLPLRGIEIELPAAADVGYGVYHFKGEHVSVAAGFRTEWTTGRH